MNELKLSKSQENKLSTYIDIETVLDRNTKIISDIPEFAATTAIFKQHISDINTISVKRNTIKKGASQTKSIKRQELESITIELASGLSVFGHKTSNEVIKAISNVSPSHLDRLRDLDIANKAVTILNTLKQNENELSPYGISVNDIASLENCIDEYKSSNIEKSGSYMESKVITKSLRELFQNCMDILDNEIDGMVNLLQTKEKNFYESYYAVRSVKNLGLRHRKQADPDSQNSGH